MLSTRLEPTKLSFDYYREVARENGYEAGPQHIGYLFKVHVEETEELAYEVGKKFLDGPGNIFLEGSRGTASPVLQNLPGLTDRRNLLPTGEIGFVAASRGRDVAPVAADNPNNSAANPDGTPTPAAVPASLADYDTQLENLTIIAGTPKTVLPKIRHVLETLRPGTIFFWDGDGAMTHDDSMRSLKLMGSDVLPAVKEMARELDLPSSFEVDTHTGERIEQLPSAVASGDGG
jgi:alkanesulfonate monooxygenase SsuD/methylene tetrahydromethanopterin reductase-like flavin-dependent oxidoreductase (luciferase family)